MTDETAHGMLTELADLCAGRNSHRRADLLPIQKVSIALGPYSTRFTRTFGSQETKDILDILHTTEQLYTHRTVINSLCQGETKHIIETPSGISAALHNRDIPLDIPARLAAERCLAVAEILERHLDRQNDLFPDDDGDPARIREIGDEVHALSAGQTTALLRVWAERLNAYADDPDGNRPILTDDLRPMPFENDDEKDLYGESPDWFPEEVLEALRKIAATIPERTAPREAYKHWLF